MVEGKETHIRQLPLAPLGELVGEPTQCCPPPLAGLGKVGAVAFCVLLGLLRDACLKSGPQQVGYYVLRVFLLF